MICCNLRLEEQLHDLKKARTAELIHFLTVKNTAEFDGEDDWMDVWMEGIDDWMDGEDDWMDGWMNGW